MQKNNSSSFQKLSEVTKHKIYLILFLCFFFSLSITAFYQYFTNSKKSQTSLLPSLTSSEITFSSAQLSLSSNTDSYSANTPFTISVVLDSNGNNIDAADVIITYDPTFLSANSVKRGNFFESWPVEKMEPGFIKVSGVASFADNKLSRPEGRGTILTIEFAPLLQGTSRIAFDVTKTIVASSGKNILDLQNLKEMTIEVQ